MSKGQRQPPITELASLSAAAAVKRLSQHRPATILVVEDEVLIRLMMAEELRRAGFVVIEAANADEAMAILQTPVQVDLIVTDIQMPGSLDGERFAALAHSIWPEIKIVIVSAFAPQWPASTIIHTFIGKPFHPDRLVERIRELLRGIEDHE
jgi:two-component system, response regulator PdtaR